MVYVDYLRKSRTGLRGVLNILSVYRDMKVSVYQLT